MGTDHTWVEVSRTAATCTTAGSVNYKCSRCSSTTADIIPPLSHSYSKTGSTAATCTSAGVDTYRCSRCSDVKTETTAQALGHDYVESGRITATCTTPGSISYACSRCDSTKTEVIPQLGTDHTWTEDSRTDAACTAPGVVHYTCSVCGDTKEEPLPALDHDWEETGRVNATCILPGSVNYQCSRCGDTKTEVIPQLGTVHAYEVAEVIPAAYDSSGNVVVPASIRYRCSVCGDEYSSVIGAAPSSPIVEDGSGGDGMFDTTASLGKTFLSGIWGLFGIYVPGFSFTFGQMWLGVLLASISILVVKLIFGFGGGPRGYSPRTGSTSNPRISKERRNDEF